LPIYLHDQSLNNFLQILFLRDQILDQGEQIDHRIESFNFETFEAKQQLLFIILKKLIIGGQYNQSSSNLEEYFEVLKELYKKMIKLSILNDSVQIQDQTAFLIQNKNQQENPLGHLEILLINN
jgi:hypothetical protein